jgi:S-DNA-T family DNA segregation ATPase FtsK/SpoIIIE
MLFLSGNEPIRLQCAFIDGPEIEEVNDFIGVQKGYPSAMLLNPVDEGGGDGPDVDLDKRDDKFEEAARLVVQHQQGSTSLIQRKLSLGYNRAGRIVDQLEAAGILGPFEGSKARQVLVQDEFSLEQILNNLS